MGPGLEAWTQPDSMLGGLFCSARERGGSAVVVPFSWSGKNSVAARRKAGTELADRLLELRREAPSRAIYVIAHSHGGSVFAYAMKEEPGLADHIDGFHRSGHTLDKRITVRVCTGAAETSVQCGFLSLAVTCAARCGTRIRMVGRLSDCST